MRKLFRSIIGILLVLLTFSSIIDYALAAGLSPPQVQAIVEDANGDGLKDLRFLITKEGYGIENVSIDISSNAVTDQPLIVGQTDSSGSCIFYDLSSGTYFWRTLDGEPNEGNITIPFEEFQLSEEEIIAWQVLSLEWAGESENGLQQILANMSLLIGYDLVQHPIPLSEKTNMMNYSRDFVRWVQDLERYMVSLNHPELDLLHKMLFPLKAFSMGIFNDRLNGVDFSQVTNMTLLVQLDTDDNSTVYVFYEEYSNGSLAGYHELLKIPAVPTLGETYSPIGAIVEIIASMIVTCAFSGSFEPDWIEPGVSWELRVSPRETPLNILLSIIDIVKEPLKWTSTILSGLKKGLEFGLERGWFSGFSDSDLSLLGDLADAIDFAIGIMILLRLVCHWAGRYPSIEVFFADLLQGNLLLAAEVAIFVVDLVILIYLAYAALFVGATASTGVGIPFAILAAILLVVFTRGDYEDAIKKLEGDLGDTLTKLFLVRQTLKDIDVKSGRHAGYISAKVADLMARLGGIADQHSSSHYIGQFLVQTTDDFATYGRLQTKFADAVGNASTSLDTLISKYLFWDSSVDDNRQVRAYLNGYCSTTVSINWSDKNGAEGALPMKAVVGTKVGDSYKYRKKIVYSGFDLDGTDYSTGANDVVRIEYGPLDLLHWFPFHLAGWASEPPCQYDFRGNKVGVLYNVVETSNNLELVPKPSDYLISSFTPSNESFYDYKFHFGDGTTTYGPSLSERIFLWGEIDGDALQEWGQDLAEQSNRTDLDLKQLQQVSKELIDFELMTPKPIDTQPPTTSLFIGKPKKTDAETGVVFVSTNTPIMLSASDGNGSGVASTGFEIRNETFATGWNTHLETAYVQFGFLGWNLSLPVPAFYIPSYLSDGEYTVIYSSTDYSGNSEIPKNTTVYLERVYAGIAFEPSTVNMKNDGKWLIAHIEIPQTYRLTDLDASNINVFTILLNNTVYVDSNVTTIVGDWDNDTIKDLKVFFNRTTVSTYILSQGIEYGAVTLILDGQLADGVTFRGSAEIMVRMPGDVNIDGKVDMRDIAPVSRAFGSDQNNSRWNSVADENEDGIVNLKDVAIVARLFGRSYVASAATDNSEMYPLTITSPTPANDTDNLRVDMKDVGNATRAFNTVPGDTLWNPHADITGPSGQPDGKVDMRDVSLIARHFGESYP